MTENQNNLTPEEVFLRLKDLDTLFHDQMEPVSLAKHYDNKRGIIKQFGSQQFTAGVEAGKRESEFIPDIEEAAIHQWDMHYGMGKDEQIKPYVIEDFKAGAKWMKNRTEQESKWIPVEERLPEESEIVLVYFPSLVRIGYLFNGAWYKYHNEGPNDPLIWPSIIAWQPLPSPPNPDKGGKEKDNG